MVMAASIGLAVVVALAGVPVFAMLVAASVIGGLGTPVGLVILVRLARDRQIMGSRPVSVPLAAAGWGAPPLPAAWACCSSYGPPWPDSDLPY